ncbi:unnamed protein product, partial [Meganyctiphanes norvegica]
SLTSSINDLSGEATVLEQAIKNNDTYQVKRLLELHHDKFQIDLGGGDNGGGGGGGVGDKSSCDTGSRCADHDLQPPHLRKGNAYSSDRLDARGGGSDGSSECVEIVVPPVFTNALHLAVDYGAADVVRLLLRYGIEPNRPGCPGLMSGMTGGSISGRIRPSPRASPRASPTSVLSVERSIAQSSLMGSPSPRASPRVSPRASPRVSPRVSPRCSPRSGSPRSQPSSPLTGLSERANSPRAPSPMATSPLPPHAPQGLLPLSIFNMEFPRLRPQALRQQQQVPGAAEEDERLRKRLGGAGAAAKSPDVPWKPIRTTLNSDTDNFFVPSACSADNNKGGRKRDFKLDVRTESRTSIDLSNRKQLNLIKSNLKNENSALSDEDRGRTISGCGTGGGPSSAGSGSSTASGCCTSGSTDVPESRSIIKDDGKGSRDQSQMRKDQSQRRVSWVPGVTDNSNVTSG